VLLAGNSGSIPDPGPKADWPKPPTKRSCPTTIPAPLQAAIDVMILLFQSLMDVLVGIIFPATVTPISALASFGVLFPLIGLVLGLVYRLVRSAG
jgi:hypothetical protein